MFRIRTASRLAGLVALLTLLTTASFGSVSTVITYQGFLKDSSGVPVNGPTNLAFAIYADGTGGTALWSEAHAATPVVGGIFSVYLGSVTTFPPTLFGTPTLWLETSVDGSALAPRTLLGSVPFAFHAAVADSVVGGGGGESLWSANGGDIYRASGNVGIGTTTPDAKLVVTSEAGNSQRLSGNGMEFSNASNGKSYIDKIDTGALWFRMGPSNDPVLAINNNGYVGIGTMTPDNKLVVAIPGIRTGFTGTAIEFWRSPSGKSYIDKLDGGQLAFRFGESYTTALIVEPSGGISFPDGTTQTTAMLRPDHEWSGTSLRFQNPDGSWGSYTDLEGPQGPAGPVTVVEPFGICGASPCFGACPNRVLAQQNSDLQVGCQAAYLGQTYPCSQPAGAVGYCCVCSP